jgi:hypothetical protein
VDSVFRVSVSYIYKALIRRRRTGEVSASTRRGHRPRKLTPEQEPALATHIAAHPDITLAVDRLGLSFKTLRAAEQDRPDVAARRRIWQAAQSFVDADKLVFIDKTGASTKMTRLYGRAPRGWRLLAKAPFGHWKTTTFVAATSSPLTSAPTISKPPSYAGSF